MTNMSDRDPLEHQRNSVYCSLISCGVYYHTFRSVDVIFWDELFRDALQSKEQGRQIELHPIQIDRMLQKMAHQKLAEVLKDGTKKIYKINPHGIVELLRLLVPSKRLLPIDETQLIQYFIDSNRDSIVHLVTQAADSNLITMLNAILAPQRILHDQITLLDGVIKDTQSRIKESENLIAYLDSQKKAGKSWDEVQNSIPSEFSYRMSYRKSFKEWLSYLPEDIRNSQFKVGFYSRKEQFYTKRLIVQQATKTLLENLLQEHTPSSKP